MDRDDEEGVWKNRTVSCTRNCKFKNEKAIRIKSCWPMKMTKRKVGRTEMLLKIFNIEFYNEKARRTHSCWLMKKKMLEDKTVVRIGNWRVQWKGEKNRELLFSWPTTNKKKRQDKTETYSELKGKEKRRKEWRVAESWRGRWWKKKMWYILLTKE